MSDCQRCRELEEQVQRLAAQLARHKSSNPVLRKYHEAVGIRLTEIPGLNEKTLRILRYWLLEDVKRELGIKRLEHIQPEQLETALRIIHCYRRSSESYGGPPCECEWCNSNLQPERR